MGPVKRFHFLILWKISGFDMCSFIIYLCLVSKSQSSHFSLCVASEWILRNFSDAKFLLYGCRNTLHQSYLNDLLIADWRKSFIILTKLSYVFFFIRFWSLFFTFMCFFNPALFFSRKDTNFTWELLLFYNFLQLGTY